MRVWAILGLCLLSTGPASATTMLGPQKTIVVTLNAPDLTEFARSVTFGQANDYLRWTSNQRLSLVGIQQPTIGDAVNVTVNYDTAGCDSNATTEALVKTAVDAAGYNYDAYDKHLIVDRDAGCGTLIGLTISAKTMFFMTWYSKELILHELGHSMGANHTDELNCGSVPFLVNPLGSCNVWGQGNADDPMGQGIAEYSAWWKSVMWGDPLTDVTADGDFTIFPLDDGTLSAAEGLRIQTSPTTLLTVEYRPRIDPGVRVSWFNSTTGHLYLLDMTPGENYYGNAGLPLGASWTDPDSGITLTHLASTGSQATVRVSGRGNVASPLTLTPSPYYHVDTTSPDGQSVAVTYALPSVSGGYPPYTGPTCAHASGSVFPVGTTYGNCSVTDSHQQTVNTLLIVGVTVPVLQPVDCVVGSWTTTATTVTATSAVMSGSLQTRTVTTTQQQERPILVQPANGGVACPAN